MIRRDYILRMIEEIGKMIAAILGLLKKGEISQAQSLYAEGLKRAFDMDENQMLDMGVDKLRFIFESKFGESFEGLEVLAGLISKGGDIHLKDNNAEKAERCYLKALELYNLVELESQSFSFTRQADMLKVTQLIDQLKSV
ncbi:hypothetical protein E9993_06645 [Labilibacter sediminis]|nr:hypothetical protein E9993_06645 [Labilibacter sediminis]